MTLDELLSDLNELKKSGCPGTETVTWYGDEETSKVEFVQWVQIGYHAGVALSPK